MVILESLMTIPDVAKLSRLSARMVQKLIVTGGCPAPLKIGRSVRLRASDVDLWIKLGCPNREAFEAAKAEPEGNPVSGKPNGNRKPPGGTNAKYLQQSISRKEQADE